MEKIMQYVWQHRLWLQQDLATVDGRRVRVIDQGLLNNDAGPDFFNAKIIIGDQTWVGNVEIHVKASDWYAHHHDTDPAYNNVVLHVVGKDDARAYRPDGEEIAQMLLPCAADFGERYRRMVMDRSAVLPCLSRLCEIPQIYITDWISTLGFERIYAKVDRVMSVVERVGGDWQAAAYVTLARALGFSINNDAFERLALATPLKVLLHNRSDATAVEGILFGQAGFLDTTSATDADYVSRLREQYTFLAAKYGLQRPQSPGWKMARMRPPTFPHRRLAALAAMIADDFKIAQRIFAVDSIDNARALFDITLKGYWASHCNFHGAFTTTAKAFGRLSVDILLINVVVPLLYAYGTRYGSAAQRDAAVDVLYQLQPESNSIVNLFVSAGISCPDAFTSQALIELRRSYCDARKCLYCRIGHRLLALNAKG